MYALSDCESYAVLNVAAASTPEVSMFVPTVDCRFEYSVVESDCENDNGSDTN